MYRPGSQARPGFVRPVGPVRVPTAQQAPRFRGSVSQVAQATNVPTLRATPRAAQPAQAQWAPQKRKIDQVAGGQAQAWPRPKAPMLTRLTYPVTTVTAPQRLTPPWAAQGPRPPSYPPGSVALAGGKGTAPSAAGAQARGGKPAAPAGGARAAPKQALRPGAVSSPRQASQAVFAAVHRAVSQKVLTPGRVTPFVTKARQAVKAASRAAGGGRQVVKAKVESDAGPEPTAAARKGGPGSASASTRPGAAEPRAPAGPPPGSAGKSGSSRSSSADLAKGHAAKLRKIEHLTKLLLHEWSGLPQAKKEEAFVSIAIKFVERVPAECLALMAEQFASGTEMDAPGGSSADGADGAANAGGGGDGPDEEGPGAEDDGASDDPWAALVEAKLEAQDDGGADPGQASDPPAFPEAGRFAKAMQQLLRDCSGKPLGSWVGGWSSLGVAPGDECSALIALTETVLRNSSSIETVSKAIMELVRNSRIEFRHVVQMLQALAGKLEELVEVNENAWHIHSHILLALFPKVSGFTFGFLRQGWKWIHWWQMTEQVLKSTDPFRAFDIMVLILQMMQEKGKMSIKDQQVWKEAGRIAKVQRALCEWGEMDESSVVETIAAYGVEI